MSHSRLLTLAAPRSQLSTDPRAGFVDGAALLAIQKATCFMERQREECQRILLTIRVSQTFFGNTRLSFHIFLSHKDGERTAAGSAAIADILFIRFDHELSLESGFHNR